MNTTPAPTDGPTQSEVIFGGSTIKLRLRPTPEAIQAAQAIGAEPAFEERPVRVRLIPIREMKTFALAWGKESAEARVYLGLDEAPAADLLERLIPEDWETLLEEGRRLNFRNFTAWHGRQRKALQAVNPGQQTNESLIQTALRELVGTEEGRKILRESLGATETPEAT
jgi:hypothetical protein